ncbi:MAG: Flp pilus assembly protein CpaB [Cyanobacteria bacterium]|nr:Flp pilus assembly protein CpaB [Cyanobacteriota bacterium]
MPKTRRPKKALVQFAVALVIAVICGIGAISVVLFFVTTISSSANVEKQRLAQEAKKAQEETEKLKRQLLTEVKPVEVEHQVLAAAEIPEGATITVDMLKDEEVTSQATNPFAITDMNFLIGKIAAKSIHKGQMLLPEMLLNTEGMLDIEPGMRAITITVDSIGAINGDIRPGVRVDVLMTLRQNLVKTLLQNVRVIAVAGGRGPAPPLLPPVRQRPNTPGMFMPLSDSFEDKATDKATTDPSTKTTSGASTDKDLKGKDKEASKTAAVSQILPSATPSGVSMAQVPAAPVTSITLSVTPAQAEILALANVAGKFHLTLRGFGDKNRAKVGGSDTAELVTGLTRSQLQKAMPSQPKPPNNAPGLQALPGADIASTQLPSPAQIEKPKNTFKMEIFKGDAAETRDFEWQP